MTAPEPTLTDEHTDAVALMLADLDHYRRGNTLPAGTLGAVYRERAVRVLTSTDPAVHEALAASLPADVMLDALVRAGVLTPERHCAHARAAQADGDYRSYTCEDAGTHCPPPRLVTPWEVAP